MKASKVKAYQSEYLKNRDLPGPAVATISKVELREIFNPANNRKDQRFVLLFKGKDKALIVNKTMCDKLINLFGDETDGWAGNAVRLVPFITDNNKASIAIELPKNGGKPDPEPGPEPEPEPAEGDDEIPF